MQKKIVWNPNKFKNNMLQLGAGVIAVGGLGAIFFVLAFTAFSSWI